MGLAGVLAIAGVIGFAAWTGAIWHYAAGAAVASYQQKLDRAQAQLEAKAQEQEKAAQLAIDREADAYRKGEDKGKATTKIIVDRGTQQLAKHSIFQNADCTLPADSLALLNAARASLRTNTLPPEPPTQPTIEHSPAPALPQGTSATTRRGTQPPKPVPLSKGGK